MKNLPIRLRDIFFLSFLLILSGCAGGSTDSGGDTEQRGGSGVLSMTIYSPYDTVIDEDEQSYYDGESKSVSKSVVASRYKDYGEAYSSSLGFSDEPYCRIGGTYKMNVQNKNRFGNYNNNIDLYNCRTTLDLINQIQIPASWSDDELTLYCNDGNLINFAELNLDFLTTQLNHYKVCVLKNEDLTQRNTIVYGYEVGNKEIDSNSKYFFSESGDNFIFANGGLELASSQSGLVENQVEYLSIPYRSWCSSCSVGGGSHYFGGFNWMQTNNLNCPVGPAPGPGSTCWSLQQQTFQSQTFNVFVPNPNGFGIGTNQQQCRSIFGGSSCSVSAYRCVSNSCDQVTPAIRSAYPGADTSSIQLVSQQAFRDSQGAYVSVNVNGQSMVGISWYKFNNKVQYSIKDYVFTQDSKTFYFGYDESSTYYSLRETAEELNTPLSSVFTTPGEFGLSRVAMFRFSDGNKKVYGYESPAKFKISGEEKSTQAVYTVDFTGGFSFKQTDCLATLASYGSTIKSTVSSGDTIVCASNNKMLLNTLAIDSLFSPGITLTLFKNIILNLE